MIYAAMQLEKLQVFIRILYKLQQILQHLQKLLLLHYQIAQLTICLSQPQRHLLTLLKQTYYFRY